jgi:starvation-inducible outer membrane lipoprotein
VFGVLGVTSAASSGEQGRTIVLIPSALLLIGLIVVTPELSGPAIALANSTAVTSSSPQCQSAVRLGGDEAN